MKTVFFKMFTMFIVISRCFYVILYQCRVPLSIPSLILNVWWGMLVHSFLFRSLVVWKSSWVLTKSQPIEVWSGLLYSCSVKNYHFSIFSWCLVHVWPNHDWTSQGILHLNWGSAGALFLNVQRFQPVLIESSENLLLYGSSDFEKIMNLFFLELPESVHTSLP